MAYGEKEAAKAAKVLQTLVKAQDKADGKGK